MKQSIVPFVVAVIKYKNKYLLTKRKEIDAEDPKDFLDKWQLPGGGINFGETTQEALLREVKEEIGISIQIIAVVPYIMNSLRQNWQGHGIVFLCKPADLSQKIVVNDEASAFGRFTISQISKLETLPGVKDAIKAAEKFF